MSEGEGTLGEVKERREKSVLREILESIIIAVVLALLIRTYILQPFFIPTGSMEPNLMVQDHIIVNKVNYRFWEPQRGDIVVFRYPVDPKRDFVKRLIGKPGERVEIRNSQLYIDGSIVNENYLPEGLRFHDFGPVKVPENSYLMLGDNRNNSDDSRVWGTLPKDLIIGKAVLIYWPLDRVQIISNE
ncbi:MAG: signal peptidase I [Peptococcaceae bacterium BRH_c4a]|nr:MAG: signal peptidase I [Peptococcaceae bacterium BRH_c4a]